MRCSKKSICAWRLPGKQIITDAPPATHRLSAFQSEHGFQLAMPAMMSIVRHQVELGLLDSGSRNLPEQRTYHADGTAKSPSVTSAPSSAARRNLPDGIRRGESLARNRPAAAVDRGKRTSRRIDTPDGRPAVTPGLSQDHPAENRGTAQRVTIRTDDVRVVHGEPIWEWKN